ncbi:syntaxin of plants 71 [Perilla frutescens var. hirtella]|nr:syntaxin of plants 71 [Perilla frutescens var. hirtella]KAH6805959.1 syntaxin of plants 71 [Perilla frutescens var. frutescens]
MTHDMDEELDRQVLLMDEIDTKVDKATADLKNANVKLKGTVNQLRSSWNVCLDIIYDMYNSLISMSPEGIFYYMTKCSYRIVQLKLARNDCMLISALIVFVLLNLNV